MRDDPRKGRKPIRFVSDWKYDHEDGSEDHYLLVYFGTWFSSRGRISFRKGWHDMARRQVPREIQWRQSALSNDDWPPVTFPRINAGLDLRALFLVHERYLKQALEV